MVACGKGGRNPSFPQDFSGFVFSYVLGMWRHDASVVGLHDELDEADDFRKSREGVAVGGSCGVGGRGECEQQCENERVPLLHGQQSSLASHSGLAIP